MELLEQLKFEEGLRLSAYDDTEGVLTIGYGHNLIARPSFKGEKIPHTITAEFAESLLLQDIDDTTIHLMSAWFGARFLDRPRLEACLNMAFELGVADFMEFKAMRKALANKHWSEARYQALQSKWAKQVPARAQRVSSQLLTGQYYRIPAA